MKLYQLFSECINTKYKSAGCCANYALRREINTLYIFFEKSNGVADWKDNLNFPAVAHKDWYAHKGFLDAWEIIKPYIANYINDTSIKRIVICGYSHGAAIAVLCHEYVWSCRPDIQKSLESYGFGCPRVLWGIKNTEIKKRWQNFTVVRNIDDLVTHLPPFLLGYFHVGKLLEIGKSGQYTKVDAHRAENILKELWKTEY